MGVVVMTSLLDLQFNTLRTPNLLMANNITTVEQLKGMTEDQLLSIRGISYATISDIEQALKRHE